LHSVNRLIRKSDENEEPWEIFKSTPRGSHSVYFWREERKGVSNGQSSEEYKVQSK